MHSINCLDISIAVTGTLNTDQINRSTYFTERGATCSLINHHHHHRHHHYYYCYLVIIIIIIIINIIIIIIIIIVAK